VLIGAVPLPGAAAPPYIRRIAGLGLAGAIDENVLLKGGLNTFAGHIVCKPVAESLGLSWSDLAELSAVVGHRRPARASRSCVRDRAQTHSVMRCLGIDGPNLRFLTKPPKLHGAYSRSGVPSIKIGQTAIDEMTVCPDFRVVGQKNASSPASHHNFS